MQSPTLVSVTAFEDATDIMSTTDAIHDAEEQFEQGDTAAAFRTLVGEVERLQNENDQLQERVDDLEAQVDKLEEELDERPDVEWEGPNPKDLGITASETGNTVYPYAAIDDRTHEEDFDYLEERVRQLEDGEADVVVRGEFDGEELPIERKIAERRGGGDLSANKARATLIFPKFGGYAETRGGSQLVLSSSDVRTILTETTDRSDWPNETVKRAMMWTAKLTSPHDEKQDWDARDEENLLTLQTGRDGALELAADLDGFNEFYQRLEEAQE